MKKVITRAVFIATFVCAAGYSLYASQHETQLADLAMANVEALANGEVIVGPWYCAGSGYCYDPDTNMLFDGTKYNL